MARSTRLINRTPNSAYIKFSSSFYVCVDMQIGKMKDDTHLRHFKLYANKLIIELNFLNKILCNDSTEDLFLEQMKSLE